MRYFITLSFDGTAYHGWQRQPNGTSVQETLEKALSTLLRTPIEVTGAGRTDAGVHASMMVAHFDIEGGLEPSKAETPAAEGKARRATDQLAYKLNKILPPDIAIQRVEAVADDLHARFSATARTYHYFIHHDKSPFRRHYAWRAPFLLDYALMNEAAQHLFGTHDFTSFSKSNTDTKTNLCTITQAQWREVEPGLWRFEVTANRFLRNMVRAIVGTLVEVGRHRISIDGFQRIIQQQDRCKAGESVPGHALFLVDIRYPDLPCSLSER